MENQNKKVHPQLTVEIPPPIMSQPKPIQTPAPEVHHKEMEEYPTHLTDQFTKYTLSKMPRQLYYHYYEQQNVKSKVYHLLRNPIPAIIIAYLIMSLIVVCPLGEVDTKLTKSDITYLLIYIPFVAIFCFAVFFSLTYTFFNISRIPKNLSLMLFYFLFIWVIIQIGSHVIIKLIGVVIPFKWIIISFGIGVPMIYLLVWISLPKHLKNNKVEQKDSEYSVESKDSIQMRSINQQETNSATSNSTPTTPSTPKYEHTSTPYPVASLLQTTPSQSEFLSIPMPVPTTPSSDTSEVSTDSTASFPNFTSTNDLTTAPNISYESMDGMISSDKPRSSMGIDNPNEKQTYKESVPKSSFLFRFWIVSSTLSLGPFGYVFFHLFLLAFYSVTSNLAQSVLIVSFQLLVLVYKFIFRLSFHRMRMHLPYIPLRVFQDGRVLFLFWLELSSHCFFSMVFPHVSSWYMIVLYIIIEVITLSLQIFVDTHKVRGMLIHIFEAIYQFIFVRKYEGTLIYRMLGIDGELDRTVSLELFFFNCTARALAGLAYIIFTLVIYFGPNKQFYETINTLSPSSYYLTLVYALASLITSFIQMRIFQSLLKRVYKLNLIQLGIKVWKRKPDVAFFFTTNCFILPLVVLLEHNNAVSYLLSFNK